MGKKAGIWSFLVIFLCLFLLFTGHISTKADYIKPKDIDLGRLADKVRGYSVVIFVSRPAEDNAYLGINEYFLDTEIGRYRVFIGAGTVVEGIGILTVNHIVEERGENGFIFIWSPEISNVIKGVVKRCDIDLDLAIIEPEKSIPGCKIAEEEPAEGEQILWIGCPHKMVLWVRFGLMEKIPYMIYVDEAMKFRIKDFHLIPLLPGGPGDSGGGVFNSRGELIGVIMKRHDYFPMAFALPMTKEIFKEIFGQ